LCATLPLPTPHLPSWTKAHWCRRGRDLTTLPHDTSHACHYLLHGFLSCRYKTTRHDCVQPEGQMGRRAGADGRGVAGWDAGNASDDNRAWRTYKHLIPHTAPPWAYSNIAGTTPGLGRGQAGMGFACSIWTVACRTWTGSVIILRWWDVLVWTCTGTARMTASAVDHHAPSIRDMDHHLHCHVTFSLHCWHATHLHYHCLPPTFPSVRHERC